jgi:hypothetical protein
LEHVAELQFIDRQLVALHLSDQRDIAHAVGARRGDLVVV